MSTLNELVYYCKEANSFGALMLTGQWGCGKTYLIEHELAEELKEEYIIIRVSLFGESSIEGINQKVKKEYFQNVLLHMGNYVEGIAQQVPGVSGEKAAQVGLKAEKLTESISGIADKLDSSKFGGIVRFVAGVEKKFPGAEKILSFNPSEYITVDSTIGDKKVILVFDDLERTNLNEVDVLGCINEYCENKHIKTIIVANEAKIASRDSESEEEIKSLQDATLKISYSEIKEKIVTRTVKNIPDYEKIISQIIKTFNADEVEYKKFLDEHKTNIIRVFNSGKFENIRSIKCAIQDFQRVFIILRENGINDELEKYLQTFIAFMLCYKAGNIQKSDSYGYLFSNYEVDKIYPEFFKSHYMLSGVQHWIVEGEWNEEVIRREISKRIEAKKGMAPKDIVRNYDLINLNEETIQIGLPEVVEQAYLGELSIDEYIILLRNVMWARNISYTLPIEIDMDKVEIGLHNCLNKICASDEPDTAVRSMIHPDNIKLLLDKEKSIYQKICEFRDNNIQMFAINRRRYIKALASSSISDLYDCENKRYNVFDIEMANSVIKYYKDLDNGNRQTFNGLFKKMWENYYSSRDLKKEESILGFEELKNMLIENRKKESAEGLGLKAALSEMLIQIVNTTIENLKSENKKENGVVSSCKISESSAQ